ncbi:MAG TPA: hypothetical protein VIF62_07795 [Labilithrix sp.]|jgi:hypothetical protein
MKRILFFLLVVAACEDINKPAAVPKSEPRTSCFSDIECPGSKCVKPSGNDIQGHCESAAPADAGADTSEPREPTNPKPQPGDIQI